MAIQRQGVDGDVGVLLKSEGGNTTQTKKHVAGSHVKA